MLNHRELCEMLLYSDKTHVLVVVWGKLYKKEVWNNLRFPEDIPCSEDQFMFDKLMEKCRNVGFLEKVVYNQVFSQESIARSSYSRNKLYHSEGVNKILNYLFTTYNSSPLNVKIATGFNLNLLTFRIPFLWVNSGSTLGQR